MTRKAAEGKAKSRGNGAPIRGRPRSEKAQKAILEATLELLAEIGLAGLTVEGVAARAGVGKATIYRRWSSKLPLVVEAITTLPELRLPATGSIRTDLRQIIGDLANAMRVSPLGRVLPHLAGQRGTDAEVDHAVGRFISTRRAPLVNVMREGVKSGELPAGLDPELLNDLFVGPIVNRMLFSRRRVDASFIDQVIASVLAGVSKALPHASKRRAKSVAD